MRKLALTLIVLAVALSCVLIVAGIVVSSSYEKELPTNYHSMLIRDSGIMFNRFGHPENDKFLQMDDYFHTVPDAKEVVVRG